MLTVIKVVNTTKFGRKVVGSLVSMEAEVKILTLLGLMSDEECEAFFQEKDQRVAQMNVNNRATIDAFVSWVDETNTKFIRRRCEHEARQRAQEANGLLGALKVDLSVKVDQIVAERSLSNDDRVRLQAELASFRDESKVKKWFERLQNAPMRGVRAQEHSDFLNRLKLAAPSQCAAPTQVMEPKSAEQRELDSLEVRASHVRNLKAQQLYNDGLQEVNHRKKRRLFKEAIHTEAQSAKGQRHEDGMKIRSAR